MVQRKFLPGDTMKKPVTEVTNAVQKKLMATEKKKPTMVAPDGGWGWVVVFALALSNVIVIPIMQSFGLLYKDTFKLLGMSATDASIIINVNSAFGMSMGLINGSLLRKFGYRKVAIVGSLIAFSGIAITSFARSFVHFFCAYSLYTSLGMGMLNPSFNLALNTYFKVRRGKATGFAMTAMGLGPVLMPLMLSRLMAEYGVQGSALILSGLSLHSLMGALLLQPVKWHLKPAPEPDAKPFDAEQEQEKDHQHNTAEQEKWVLQEEDEVARRRRHDSIGTLSINHDLDSHSIYGFETPSMEHRRFNGQHSGRRKTSATSFQRSISHDAHQWWGAGSVETVNLGSSVKIFEERAYVPLKEEKEETFCEKKKITKKPPWSLCRRFGSGIVALFDLGLLSDPLYVNLMLGMSLAICAEINFSLMTPFILGDRGFSNDETATIMATIASTDIVFRFVSPYVADGFHLAARTMYMIALVMLISCRTALIFSESFTSVMIVGVSLGVSKGVRTVYMSLVIPSYVPLERLASASGIQMLCNGTLLLCQGPIIGFIRDVSGNYNTCIAVINVISFLPLVMWSTEIIIMWYRRRGKEPASDTNC